jgi:hypothetical protein
LRCVCFWVRAMRKEKGGALLYFWELERQKDRVRAARLAAESSVVSPSFISRMPSDVFERLSRREFTLPSEVCQMLEVGQILGKPDFSRFLVRLPRGSIGITFTISWQGSGNIEISADSPSRTYREDAPNVCVKQTDRSVSGVEALLSVKRVSVPISALSTDEVWHVVLEFYKVEDYSIVVEVQERVKENLVFVKSAFVQTRNRLVCQYRFWKEFRLVQLAEA